jgi:hypothetical protein
MQNINRRSLFAMAVAGLAGLLSDIPATSAWTQCHQVQEIRGSAVNPYRESDATESCRGNACGDVSVSWTGSGYEIANHGSKRVRVRIRFMWGYGCLDWTSYVLDPGESDYSSNGGYCEPYEAHYLK